MANIVVKGNSGLFENEIELYGKYASEIRFLKDEAGVFNSLRDAYMVAAIVGFITKANVKVNEEENVKEASIFSDEIKRRRKDLRFIYQLIMLLDDNPDYNIDDYKNRTFRDDPEEYPETIQENMTLFNNYVCKGLDYLYDKFINCTHLDETVDTLYNFLHELAIATDLIHDDEELPDFTPDFH